MKTWTKLVALTLLCCLCAVAVVAEDSSVAIEENSPAFDLAFEAPEGAEVAMNSVDGTTILDIVLADRPDMKYVITVAADDRYAGRNLADFSEEDLNTLFASLLSEADAAQSSYSMKDLHEGNKAMLLEFKEIPEVANVLTIQDGYYLQVFGMYNDFTQLVTQADFDTALKLLDLVHVIPATAPAK